MVISSNQEIERLPRNEKRIISMICRSALKANPLIKLYTPYRYFGRKWYGNPITVDRATCACTVCNGQIDGFLVGAGAIHAGLAYRFNSAPTGASRSTVSSPLTKPRDSHQTRDPGATQLRITKAVTSRALQTN